MGNYKSVYKFDYGLYIDTVQAFITILATSAAKVTTESMFSGIANLTELYYNRKDSTNATLSIKMKDSNTWDILVEAPYVKIRLKSNNKLLKHFKQNELIISDDLGFKIETDDRLFAHSLYNEEGYPSDFFEANRDLISSGNNPSAIMTYELDSYPGISLQRELHWLNLIDKTRSRGNLYIEKVAMTCAKIVTKLFYTGTEEIIIEMETIFGDNNFSGLSTTNKRILGIDKKEN